MERSVLVRLRANISDYRSQMDAAGKAGQKVGKDTAKGGADAAAGMDKAAAAAKRAAKSTTEAGTAGQKAKSGLDGAGKAAKTAAQGLDQTAKTSKNAAAGLDGTAKSSKKAADGLDQTAKSSKKTADETRKIPESTAPATTALGRLSESALKNRDAWDTSGRAVAGAGALIAGALVLTAKAAIDWESSWAGVTKTIDGTPEQLSEIEAGLRGMARVLPATHGEIAAVAEAAGQLGVRTEDILGFTKVMVDLGETTNLTADEAATSIAQLMNVMGTAPGKVTNLGSTLVELGNNGASTERQIVQMAQRIAGAGAIVGASEADVLALANALASVGIEVEAGGSAISGVLVKMAEAVETNNKKLATFAQVAGMSADEFSTAFRTDPIAALDMFVLGLGEMDAAGGNVFGTLNDLTLGEIRTRDALLRLAAGGDILTTSLEDGARAWEQNNALAEEAGKRYDTTAAQLSMARNSVNDAAISIGDTMLPVLASLAETTATAFGWFADLPGPLQAIVASGGALVAVLSLAGGGFLLLFPRIVETHKALRELNVVAPRAAGFLRGLGRATVVASGLMLVASAIDAIAGAGESGVKDIEATTRALLKLGEGGDDADAALDTLFADLDNHFLIGGQGVDTFADALDRIFSPSVAQRYSDFSNAALHVVTLGQAFGESSDELANARDVMENVDTALANLIEGGNLEEFEGSFAALVAAADAEGISLEQLMTLLPQVAEAQEGLKNQQDLGTSASERATSALEDQAAAAGMLPEEYEEAAKGVRDMVESWAESLASAVDPLGAWETANQRAAETAAEAAGAGKEAWQDFADGVSASFDQYLAELAKQVEAQQNWQTNLALIADKVTPAVMGALIEMGPAAAPLIQEMVDGTTEQFDQLNTLLPQSLADTQLGIADELRKWNQVASTIAEMFGQDVATNIAVGIGTGQTTVAAALAELGLGIEEAIPGTVTVGVELETVDFHTEVTTVQDTLAVLRGEKPTVTVDMAPTPFNDKFVGVNEDIAWLGSQTPTPLVDIAPAPFYLGLGTVSTAVDELDAETPTPTANLHITELLNRSREANGYLTNLDGERPTPVADLDFYGVSSGVQTAQGVIDGLHGKTVDAEARTRGTNLVSNLLDTINALYSKTVQVTVNYKQTGTVPKSNATGTQNFEGGLTWVGEEGPELLALPRGSRIWSSPESRQLASSITTTVGDVAASRNSITVGGMPGVGVDLNGMLQDTGAAVVMFGAATDTDRQALESAGWQGSAGESLAGLDAAMGRSTAAFDQLAARTVEIAARLRAPAVTAGRSPAPNGFAPADRPNGKAPLNLTQRYARDMLAAIKSGKRVEEDFAWAGMGEYSDDLRFALMDGLGNVDISDYTPAEWHQMIANFLQRYLNNTAAARSSRPLNIMGNGSAETNWYSPTLTLPTAGGDASLAALVDALTGGTARSGAGRGGNVYQIQAPTTAAGDLIEAAQKAQRRADALSGFGVS